MRVAFVAASLAACDAGDDWSPAGAGGANGTGGGTSSSTSSGTAICDTTLHEGIATYYDFADGSGKCHFPPSTGNQMVVALNDPEFADAAMCGACIHVTGPEGEVDVIVVNACPGCDVGHLDLSPEAYDLIAATYQGVPPITWQIIPCDVQGPIRYHYFEGSSPTWAWVHVRNHRHPIATLEFRDENGTFVELERVDWNYFRAQGLPAGDQTYRVTDSYGQQLVDEGIPVLDEGEVPGSGQFPPCQ